MKKTSGYSFSRNASVLPKKNLRKANEARNVAENLAEEARWKVAETNGSCTYLNAKFVQLTAQDEQIKAECKNHEAKSRACAQHSSALDRWCPRRKRRWLL